MGASSKNLILGIDPGFSGGLALLYRNTGELRFTSPVLTVKAHGRPEIDAHALLQWLTPHAPHVGLCAIEDVSAMPGQGVTGMFRFGYGAGLMSGIVIALGIPLIRIKPAVWKAALGLSREKGESIALASMLFDRPFAKRDDGVAEAALIAHFARLRF